MKSIYISLDELDSTLSRLWEMCEDKGCAMVAAPSTNHIEIKSSAGETLAAIEVISITDPYDIRNAIFNE